MPRAAVLFVGELTFMVGTGLLRCSSEFATEPFVVPTYTPDTMVLGARPNFSIAFAPSYATTTANVGLGRLFASQSD